MKKVNKSGLSRNIPARVKREVRRRCKFGCVKCRSGFYQYEHIDPFESVKSHDPDRICCLCASCHDAVTRGQLSKSTVDKFYQKISSLTPAEVGPPIGLLDFHSGSANLAIGGLNYSPAVKSVLRYYGTDIIRVEPGDGETPGAITALFHDDNGNKVFQLNKNEWIGESTNWDIEVTGPRLIVKNPSAKVVLRLRLEPPGNIVIEQLDMRFKQGHLLVSESSYAVGRYLDNDSVFWLCANMEITRATPDAIGIEFVKPSKLKTRVERMKDVGKSIRASNGHWVIGSPVGVAYHPLGVSIGYGCAFNLYFEKYAVGCLPIDTVRHYVWRDPDGLRAAMQAVTAKP